jgi:hypothetical protein
VSGCAHFVGFPGDQVMVSSALTPEIRPSQAFRRGVGWGCKRLGVHGNALSLHKCFVSLNCESASLTV